jgi:hypothetical protein
VTINFIDEDNSLTRSNINNWNIKKYENIYAEIKSEGNVIFFGDFSI